MVHLVYCDNTGKKREKVLDNLADTKTMVAELQGKNTAQQSF